jgi:hypothetical protein
MRTGERKTELLHNPKLQIYEKHRQLQWVVLRHDVLAVFGDHLNDKFDIRSSRMTPPSASNRTSS